MIGVAWATLRDRKVSFAGAFVALALAVGTIGAVLTVMFSAWEVPLADSQRYADAQVVVRSVGAPDADDAGRDDPRPGLSPDVVDELAQLGPVVEDRMFFVHADGGPTDVQVGRPWSAATLAPHRLTAGRAPRANDEIVVPADAAEPGAELDVVTSSSVGAYRVVGATAPVEFESPLFFTDDEAERLSPRVDAVALDAPEATVRGVVGDRAEVLAGAERRRANPDHAALRHRLLDTTLLVGVSGGVATFVTIFVVASTFAFMVDQRGRELALLRTAGATSRQVRRTVAYEAMLLGGLACVVGVVLALVAVPLLVELLVGNGVAPEGFAADVQATPLVIACVVGLGVALLGAWSASRRAGTARPMAALRESAVESRPMTRGRWLLGSVVLLCALVAMAWVAANNPRLVAFHQIYLGVLLLPIAAVALLAPPVIPFLVRVLTWPTRSMSGAVGMLAREGALVAARRTASTAAPVLLLVGVPVTVLGAVHTVDVARAHERAEHLHADFVVEPVAGDELSWALMDALQDVDDAEAAAIVSTTVYVTEEDGRVRDEEAVVVDSPAVPSLTGAELSPGSFADLDDDGIVVPADWEGVVLGQPVDVTLADGSAVSLRVVGTSRPSLEQPQVYVAPDHVPDGLLPQRILVAAGPEADLQSLAGSLGTIADDLGARVTTSTDWVAANDSADTASAALAVRWTLVFTVVYCAIVVAATMAMATRGRRHELAALRLAGATKGQTLRTIGADALVAAVVGVVLAAVAVLPGFAGMLVGLRKLVTGASAEVPWDVVVLFALGGVLWAVVVAAWSARKIVDGTRLK